MVLFIFDVLLMFTFLELIVLMLLLFFNNNSNGNRSNASFNNIVHQLYFYNPRLIITHFHISDSVSGPFSSPLSLSLALALSISVICC